MVTPSMNLEPVIPARVTGIPLSIITAMAQVVRVIVMPDRWTVAKRSGMSTVKKGFSS
jgi:hypothetical protein